MQRRGGFTLMEILVVVSVIVILIAILIPSLGKARKQAKTTICMTNEKALVMAYRMYLQDWNTTLVAGNGTKPGSAGHGAIYGAWDYQILGAGVTQASYYNNNARRDVTDNIRWCPETTRPRRPGPAVGTASSPWDCRAGNYGGSTGSYGFNNWLYRYDQFQPQSGTVSADDFYKFRSISNDSSVPVFADAVWHDFLPRTTDLPGTNTSDPEGSTSADRTLADVAIKRHNKAINVGFLDGHVQTVILNDLWTLRWSATWNRSKPQFIP